MKDFLRAERERRDAAHLQRNLRWLDNASGVHVGWEGQRLVNFSSNDYLGLAQHAKLKEAAIEATDRFGAGAGAARLVCGTLPEHRELEKAIAQFKGAESALSFSTGYAAAVGAIPSLVGAEDVVIVDKLVHASLVDGAKLSGAKLRVFKHNNLADLERVLEWARRERPQSNILIITESVFSMDGDLASVGEIVALKERFGAWLMVDEAHGIGVLEPTPDRIEVRMGTLGKAVGSSGGFIAGSAELIDHLINSARSFIFSTAPGPAAVAAARAGIELIASAEGRNLITRLRQNIHRIRPQHETAIIPIILGDEAKALAASEILKEAGFLVPAIRYPTVARGQARLRVTVSALHTDAQIDGLLAALKNIGADLP